MSRKAKVLGIALAVALALNAVSTAGARAQLKVTTTGSTWLTFDAIGKQVLKIGVSPEIICTAVGGHANVENNQTKVTATSIKYTGCTSPLTVGPVTVKMEGCDYLFHGGETDAKDSTHATRGEVDLVCPEGKILVIEIYTSIPKHTAGEALCKLRVPGFTNHAEITYTNTPETGGSGIPNDFDLKAVSVPFAYTREGSILCGSASGEGSYNGEITMTGYEDDGSFNGAPIEGEPTSVTIS